MKWVGGVTVKGLEGDTDAWGESEDDGGYLRYLSFRLLTSLLLKSSTSTGGSSSVCLSVFQLVSVQTDTKPSPSITRSMRSGLEPRNDTLVELSGEISSPSLLALPFLSAAPMISPSSISE